MSAARASISRGACLAIGGAGLRGSISSGSSPACCPALNGGAFFHARSVALPLPTNPNEMAELQRAYVNAARDIKRIAERIERVQVRVAS